MASSKLIFNHCSCYGPISFFYSMKCVLQLAAAPLCLFTGFHLAVFFPTVIAAGVVFYSKKSRKAAIWSITAAILQPAALLIDHGHFQYNNISLGLSVSLFCLLPPNSVQLS